MTSLLTCVTSWKDFSACYPKIYLSDFRASTINHFGFALHQMALGVDLFIERQGVIPRLIPTYQRKINGLSMRLKVSSGVVRSFYNAFFLDRNFKEATLGKGFKEKSIVLTKNVIPHAIALYLFDLLEQLDFHFSPTLIMKWVAIPLEFALDIEYQKEINNERLTLTQKKTASINAAFSSTRVKPLN